MSTEPIHQIEFSGEQIVPIQAGQSILEASLQAGIPHFHACGGHAKCSTCRILVLEGMEHLSLVNASESALRKKIFIPKDVRLACQTFVTKSPVRIKRMIRDETDVYLYVHNADNSSGQEIGQEKELVLFFLDIRRFTPFMETLLPFDVIHIIRRLFLLFEKAISKRSGSIIETAGDGLYAIFASGADLSVAATNAYGAGKEILAELKQFNEEYLKPHFLQSISLGIGMHAGKVIAGTFRIGDKDQLTVMGLPVIIASRLQSATRTLNSDFVVSGYVYSMIIAPPEAEKCQVQLKGLSETQEVYLLGSPFEE